MHLVVVLRTKRNEVNKQPLDRLSDRIKFATIESKLTHKTVRLNSSECSTLRFVPYVNNTTNLSLI